MLKKILSVFLCVGIVSGCASHPKSDLKSNALSPEEAQEVAIGQQIHNTILSSFYPYTEPRVVGYVNKVGQSLAAHAERRELPYQFTVLYSDKIYATSSPGGYVYLTTGMLYFVENESELAAVLAHEIAQLQYKDPQNSKARKTLEAVSKGGAMVAPAFGGIGMLAMLGFVAVNTAAQPRTVNPSQKLIQADQKAIHYMVEAKEDPQGMIDLMYRFLKAKTEVVPYFADYYQSRPITEDRVKSLSKNFEKLPLAGKTFETNREVYQETTKGIREIYKQ